MIREIKGTKIIKINKDTPQKELIKYVADRIKKGCVICFPTDTVYGIGASIFHQNAVKRIFFIKGRDFSKPLTINIGYKKDVYNFVYKVDPLTKNLIKKFWPGALTLIFFKKSNISDLISAKTDKIGIRMPNHKIQLSIIREVKVPIVSTSANLSGEKEISNPKGVIEKFAGCVDLIIDGGICDSGISSTVLDLTTSPPKILREGSLKKKVIETCMKK